MFSTTPPAAECSAGLNGDDDDVAGEAEPSPSVATAITAAVTGVTPAMVAGGGQ